MNISECNYNANTNLNVNTANNQWNNTLMNPFKNPYHLTFFNQATAKKHFSNQHQQFINNKSKEATSRTPNDKIVFRSKVPSTSRNKLVPKSKTPKLHSIKKISTVQVKQTQKDNHHLKSNNSHKETKDNGLVSITLTKVAQRPIHLQVHTASTRNNNLTKNVMNPIKKENTITGMNIKTISQTKKSIGDNNSNKAILTANLLSKDIRLKMLKKDNVILLGNSNRKEERIDASFTNSNRNKEYNKGKGQYVKATKMLPSKKMNPNVNGNANVNVAGSTINDNTDNDNNNSTHPSFKPPSQLRFKYIPKNQYRELIDLYLISEDIA